MVLTIFNFVDFDFVPTATVALVAPGVSVVEWFHGISLSPPATLKMESNAIITMKISTSQTTN
jgi:hypothetical protein